MKPVFVWSVIFLVLVSKEAISDEVVLQDWETYTQPTLINSERAKIPGAMHAQDVEGWVDLEVTVGLDGTAHSPRIIETSIAGIFDKATLEAVNKWRFEPATINGKPVEATFTARQTFYFKDNRDGVTEAFFRRASGISRALAKGDLVTADKKIQQLDEKRRRTLAEGVYMDLFKSTYYEKSGDTQSALQHLNRALGSADNNIPKPVREHLLRSAVNLNAEQRNFASALNRYGELEGLMGQLPADDPAKLEALAIQSIIAGDETLEWEAILEHCKECDRETYSWSHPLLRNQFTVSTVPDSLEETQLRCGDRFQYFRLRQGETYVVPGLGADCFFHTQGWQPVSFSFIELPAAEAVGSE